MTIALCRVVSLDRGELDKIIERSVFYQRGEDKEKSERKREYEDKSRHHGYEHDCKYERKKRSFLAEIFD